jgi:3-deoxy-D-manno-octulosonic-acid transferase
MIIIYNILIFVATILFLPVVFFKILSNKNLKTGIKERLTIYNKKFLNSIIAHNKIIWIHASSVGEVNISKLLIENFKKFYPDFKILITVMTSAGYETASRANLFDFITFIPFDLSIFIKRFLKIVQPKIILVAETEFWPNMFYYSNKKNIPLIVFNCRISDNSIKNYLKFKFFFKKILNKATYFLCQNQVTVNRLILLDVNQEKIKLTKNIKFDLNFPKFDIKTVYKELYLENKKDTFIITAGSTHHNEEEIILNIFEKLNKSKKNLFLIIAPRHVQRSNEIIEFLKNRKLKFNLFSEKKLDKNSNILIIDKIGVLIKAYSISDICFIGGGMTLRGGQNPLEAIYFKKPVISGKNIFNFKEIYNLLDKNNGVVLVDNEFILETELKKLIENKNYREQIAQNGYEILKENRGAIEKTLEFIKQV